MSYFFLIFLSWVSYGSLKFNPIWFCLIVFICALLLHTEFVFFCFLSHLHRQGVLFFPCSTAVVGGGGVLGVIVRLLRGRVCGAHPVWGDASAFAGG